MSYCKFLIIIIIIFVQNNSLHAQEILDDKSNQSLTIDHVNTLAMGGGTILYSSFAGVEAVPQSIPSQNHTNSGNSYQSVAADDFTVNTNAWQINEVQVLGENVLGTGPIESFNVYILGNNVDIPDTTNLSAGAIYAAENMSYIDAMGEFTIHLPGSGIVLSNGTYWLVVQANMNPNVGGMWGWTQSSSAPGSNTPIGFESTWFQSSTSTSSNNCINTWGSRVTTCGVGDQPDMAFQLIGNALMPGIDVTPTSLNTNESGTSDFYRVVLTAPPLSGNTVNIPVSVGDVTEANLSTNSLVFNTGNWNIPQTVTVTGIDDGVADGNVMYTITNGGVTSGDLGYDGMMGPNVTGTNYDDEIGGITVSIANITVSEDGLTTATIGFNANTPPTDDVMIPISSSDSNRATVSGPTVTLPSGSTAIQMITITGVDDDIDNGDLPFMIVTGDPTSVGDAIYDSFNANSVFDIKGVRTDDDSADIVFNPSSVTTDETGSSDTFDVFLDSEPTADVNFSIVSSDITEGTTAVTGMTFTTANWDTPQTVTITGEDDDIDDGSVNFIVITSTATSMDDTYNGFSTTNVSATNNDDTDTAGITVAPVSGLVTGENGSTDTFTIVLESEPTADVSIDLSSSDTTEGTVLPINVVFTASNWDTPQTLTVTGVDDFVADGDVAYTIITDPATSSDLTYQSIDPQDVMVTNNDDEGAAGITITPTMGLVTDESGTNDSFDIVLDSQPIADVTVDLSSSDISEGTLSSASVTFTAGNWDTPQTITITGVNDDIVDGDINFTIVTNSAMSSDLSYNGINPDDVNVTNNDDTDTAGISISPNSGLITDESGITDSFNIVLDSEPTANVSVGLTSSDTSEGTISSSSVTFTPANWDTMQTITVTGVNDNMDDGNILYSIITDMASSADLNYSGINPADVSLTNNDNDSAGISVNPASGLVTDETGLTDTFDIVLNTEPTADVTIGLMSSDTGEGTISESNVIFTSINWDTPQTVTITGIDDDLEDGNIQYSIMTSMASSADMNYIGINPADVSVTNNDNDSAGISINPSSGLVTDETGLTDTFDIVLNTEPTADVTISLMSSDTGEGTISVSNVIFTITNWDTPQTVTISGVDDNLEDGNIQYSIITDMASSTDINYSVINPVDVSVTNNDNDSAGISVNLASGLVTDETGLTDTFDIVLNTEPTADVTIGLTSSDTTEGMLSTASLVFTTANWNVPQTVIITGVNDNIVDGNISYSILTSPSTSSDINYQGIDPTDVMVVNNDDLDAASVVASATSGLVTTENGGFDTFDLSLTSEPTDNVSIDFSVSDDTEGSVSPVNVVFTAANWNLQQTITVTGVDDNINDGDIIYTVVTSNTSSLDSNYNGIDVPDVQATNIDKSKSANVTIDPLTPLYTNENGNTASFTVVLNSQPTADVTLPLSSSNPDEGLISQDATNYVSALNLVFNSTNWNIPQLVTIQGQADSVFDSNVEYTIITGAIISTDPNYNGINPPDLSVINGNTDAQIIPTLNNLGIVLLMLFMIAFFNYRKYN